MVVEMDASDGVIVGVLYQKQADREWHLVAYYSKTIIDIEVNYLIYNKKILAIVSSFKHWCVYLKGISEVVHIMTDHKALEYFMTTKALTAQ